MTKQKLRLAFGGILENFMNEQNVRRMVQMGATEFILTSLNLDPHPEFATLAHQNGCTAGYDMEIALWAGTRPPCQRLDLSQPSYQESFAEIKKAGFDFAISEGLFGDAPLQIKRSGLPYYNMGGENGENMHNQYYGHPLNSHDANYPEAYHKSQADNYFNTSIDYWNKCKNFGLTFEVYASSDVGGPCDLLTDPNAMLQFMDRLEGAGVRIGTVHFWAGQGDMGLLSKVDAGGLLNPLYNALKTTYGFTR